MLHFALECGTSGEERASQFAKDNLEKKKFLKEIPPFPLDVSTAAYSLKETQVPYAQYLNSLNEQNAYFDENQNNMLRDVGKYTKTRYAIVSLSLNQILESNEKYKDTLLLISLIDSQNIPKDLLYSYKGRNLSDDFLRELKKRSFINEEESKNNKTATFSIHRSVQKVFLSYLIRKYNLEKGSKLVTFISNKFNNYCTDIIDKEDILRSQILKNHCMHFLGHNNLFTKDITGMIKVTLGRIHFYAENYFDSEKLLEESLSDLRSYYGEQCIHFAQPLVYLGIIYRIYGKREKSKKNIEESILIYNKNPSKDLPGFAWALAQLGNVHKEFGEYRPHSSAKCNTA